LDRQAKKVSLPNNDFSGISEEIRSNFNFWFPSDCQDMPPESGCLRPPDGAGHDRVPAETERDRTAKLSKIMPPKALFSAAQRSLEI
jgi:hypothetical protein